MLSSYMQKSTIVSTVLLALAASPVDGFWRMGCSQIQNGRVDPIVTPGGIAGHTHKIAGGSNFNINSTFASLAESECSSCSVQADKSNYWTPQLFYRHVNGTFEMVGEHSGMVVYYLGRGKQPNGNATAVPFPEGLQMLSGSSTARTYNDGMTWGNKTFRPRPIGDRVSFACIDYNNPKPETDSMSDTNCSDGLRAQLHFQTCWNGKDLYKSDQSHVAYLSQIDNGICPPDYPVLLPHLFFEVLYDVKSINKEPGGAFVFSNGDMTGFGFHGDFMNGWDTPTLQAAIPCLIGNTNGVTGDCPALAPTNRNDFSTVCPQRQPIFPCEYSTEFLPKLPGCNTPTGNNSVAPFGQTACPAGSTASCSPNHSQLPAVPYPGDSKYKSLGCYTEAVGERTLGGVQYVDNYNMTNAKCESLCKGSTYWGVEYHSECYCGTKISSGAASAISTDCNFPCSGNEWEICGGSNRINIFQKIASTVSSSTRSSTVSTAKSTSSSKAPTTLSTRAASTSSSKPASSSTKPASSSTKPASSSTKPASSSTKPASSSTKPASSSTKPASTSSAKQTSTSSMRTMTTSTLKTMTTSKAPTTTSKAPVCAQDLCYRALLATQIPGRIESAQSFCATFTKQVVTATSAIPSYAAAGCTGDVVSRLSSVCPCVAAYPTPAPTN